MTNIRKKSANELSSGTVNTYYNFLQYMRISKTQVGGPTPQFNIIIFY